MAAALARGRQGNGVAVQHGWKDGNGSPVLKSGKRQRRGASQQTSARNPMTCAENDKGVSGDGRQCGQRNGAYGFLSKKGKQRQRELLASARDGQGQRQGTCVEK
jgi:hypothetical protein